MFPSNNNNNNTIQRFIIAVLKEEQHYYILMRMTPVPDENSNLNIQCKDVKVDKDVGRVVGVMSMVPAAGTCDNKPFTMKERNVLDLSGVNIAMEKDILKGKTFVISGVFPQVGGGDKNVVGHARIKEMIESFGGRVIKRFSKKTSKNFLYFYIHFCQTVLFIFDKQSSSLACPILC